MQCYSMYECYSLLVYVSKDGQWTEILNLNVDEMILLKRTVGYSVSCSAD